MDISVTETVRHWGACSGNGCWPAHSLVEFRADLDKAIAEIPAEHMGSAEIDFEPDYEHGEHYSSVRITYERPETAEEVAQRHSDQRKHWESQLADARQRVEYCEAQLATRIETISI